MFGLRFKKTAESSPAPDGLSFLISPKNIPRIYLICHIIQTRIIPVRNNRLRYRLELIEIIHNLASKEYSESARDTLRELSSGQKLPSLKALKAERDDLVLTKNGQYESYQTARMEEKELQTICSNVHQMLDLNQSQTLEKERGAEIS